MSVPQHLTAQQASTVFYGESFAVWASALNEATILEDRRAKEQVSGNLSVLFLK
jgi:hypothetical protein